MMSFDTKVLLIAIAEIVGSNDDIKIIYEAIAKMANAEGVVLESFEEFREKRKVQKANNN